MAKVRHVFAHDIIVHPGSRREADWSAHGRHGAKVVTLVAGKQTAFARVRHALQDACIVGEMDAAGLIDADQHPHPYPASAAASANTAFIELGAGKGLLGLACKAVSPSSTLIMVERNGVRKKADKSLRAIQAIAIAAAATAAATATAANSASSTADVAIDGGGDLVDSDGNDDGDDEAATAGAAGATATATGAAATATTHFRVRMDIRHVFLPQLPGITVTPAPAPTTDDTGASAGAGAASQCLSSSREVVIIAKHLWYVVWFGEGGRAREREREMYV